MLITIELLQFIQYSCESTGSNDSKNRCAKSAQEISSSTTHDQSEREGKCVERNQLILLDYVNHGSI